MVLSPSIWEELFLTSLVTLRSVNAKEQDPGTYNNHFLGSRSLPLPAGARLSLASSTGCCQPQLSSKSSGAQVRSKPSLLSSIPALLSWLPQGKI